MEPEVESEIESRGYELAYHLTPDLEEAEMASRIQELQNLISQSGGAVLTSRPPRRQHLSYPIKQKKYSYFGVFDFKASPETIEKINTQMKLQTSILRYLVTKKLAADKEVRALSLERPRPRLKTHEPVAPTKPTQEVKPEQLEKEIEEALEKI